MGLVAGKPYRDYILALDRGHDAIPEEASKGEDNQGAPTWSPDGRFLVYGNVRCREENSCAIHQIDLSKHESTKIAGSDGLTTARLSPDGRHIAALNISEHAIYILDTQNSTWRKLTDQVDGNDLSWSSDSTFVYAKSYMRGTVEIVRVPASGGAMQTVIDLNVFSKAAGQLDTWFGLTPDNSIMLNHVLMTNEIYDITYSN